MKDVQLYQALLGVESPWKVADVQMDMTAKEIEIEVICTQKVWACPKCRTRMHVHSWNERRWRHLDTCQFKTFVRANVPRVECPEHGTQTVQVPWAEVRSRFTEMFERLAIDVMLECSINAAGKILRISWEEADGIKQRAVKRGLGRKPPSSPKKICIDEKSVGRGHDYVSLVIQVDEKGPSIDYIASGRTEEALKPYWEGLSDEALQGIECVAMDMWDPFVKSVRAHVPDADSKIVHDPFHLVQHMNKAVDAVRRHEVNLLPSKDSKPLKGTRQMWLYGIENLPKKWASNLKAFKDSKFKTARAWHLKEMFRGLYRCENLTQAHAYWKEWNLSAMKSKLEPVKKVARMIKERIDQVLTFFVHRHTNAHAESMNSRIQAMIKKANGYRNRERLCTDMFFHFGALNLHP
ncbi:MAG: transposase [Verrucomicrobiales bacterium]|jgi:transposase